MFCTYDNYWTIRGLKKSGPFIFYRFYHNIWWTLLPCSCNSTKFIFIQFNKQNLKGSNSFDLNFLITSLVSSNSSYPSRASELNPSYCGVHGAWSLVFCVVFCRSLFLGVFFPLYCLSFDLQILITPLVSSNSSFLYRASELNPFFVGFMVLYR